MSTTQFRVAVHALISRDGRFLATRRSPVNDYMPGKWDIPGGYVESGETMEAALVRELSEEVGLHVAPLGPLFVYTNLSQLPAKQTFQAIYACEYLEGDVKLNPEEHDKYEWLEAGSFRRLDAMAFVAEYVQSRSFPRG